VLDSLGYIHACFGDHHLAQRYYRDALELFRRNGERYYESDTLAHLAEAFRLAGDRESADAVQRRARVVLEELDLP
jgi:tetratricopeptide (TPR) repeat protein